MLPRASVKHYKAIQRLEVATRAQVRRAWRLMTPEFDQSWQRVERQLLGILAAAQATAAQAGSDYVGQVLAETDQASPAVGDVVPTSLAAVASDGRPLDSLLYGGVTRAKDAMATGVTTTEALESGRNYLDMAVLTQVADAARVASGVSIAAREDAIGYVRMLNPPSCGRCAVQAGRWFRYNAGFQRHPRCDCVHVPARSQQWAEAEGLIASPEDYFDGLSRAEQDHHFTKAGADAIRDGADIGQVVNARRGARGLTPAGARITKAEARDLRLGRDRGHLQSVELYGRQVYTTTEGATVRGFAGSRLGNLAKMEGQRYRVSRTPRLMPESIYEIAEDKADAQRLLRRYGYIL